MALSLPRSRGTIVSEGGTAANEIQKILVVGQKDATGTATSGELIQDVVNFEDIDALFGKPSQINAVLRSMLTLKRNIRSPQNPQIDVIPLADDGGAVKAAGSVAFTGTATADGEYTLIIGSEINNTYTLKTTDTQTNLQISAAFAALITTDEYAPVIASDLGAGGLELTAVNGGEVGNGITLKFDGETEGVTALLTGMSGGTTNPVLTTLFDPVANLRYQTVTAPSVYGRQYLEDFLEPRFNTNTFELLDGVAVLTATDTFANLLTLVNPVLGLNNSRVLVTVGNRLVNEAEYKGSSIRELDSVISGQIAFIRALRLTDGSFLQDIIATRIASSLDRRGGAALASLPYFNTRGLSLPLVDLQKEWSVSEQAQALAAGLSIIGNSNSRSFVQFGEFVTSYKKDSQGFDDNTFKFLNFVDTEVTIREVFKNELIANFPQSRLIDGTGEVVSGRNIATEQGIEAELISIYADLSSSAFALTNNSVEALKLFKTSLTVKISRAERSVTIFMRVPIVSQLAEIDITFAININ